MFTEEVGESSVNSVYNQTQFTFRQTDRKTTLRDHQHAKAGENKRLITDQSRTTTPDGCKGVQIDSSLDMNPESYF